MIDALTATGLSRIEITSFVNPKWIPQLADATEVARGIKRKEGVVYSCLVPNKKGLEKALDGGHEGGRGLLVGVGDAQQEEREQDHRRDAGRVRGGDRAGARRRACACAPTSRRCTAARTRARSIPKKVVALVEELRAARRLPDLARRHHRRGARRCRCASVLERRLDGGAARRRSRCTSTTRAARRWPTCSSPSAWASRRSTRPSAASAAVPTRPAPAATWRRRTSSTCCTAWASRPASISTRSASPRRASRRSSGTRCRRSTPRRRWASRPSAGRRTAS